MIPVVELTDELLRQLGEELGDCDFTSECQREYLSAVNSCDVQAAPGNGKTTLLVAKLALLSRVWKSRTQGICVISHTNAAREEIEEKLFNHPVAATCLRYPHFIGTVTAFIDRFLALPYLRGLGWSVQRIDDEMFAAIAQSRIHSIPALKKYSFKNDYSLRKFVSNLELAPNFSCPARTVPTRLEVASHPTSSPKQPGPSSPTGSALQELKAEMVRAGYYRYSDMQVIAERAIRESPRLLDVIRRRFPLVILDEAQDTNGEQLSLLRRIFESRVAFQCLGDENQTLYDNDSLKTEDYWCAGKNVIPLNESRRFGPEIAAFASRLTVRSAQQIEGKKGVPCRRSLILFDDFSIANVLPAYADEVKAHWGDKLSDSQDIWAVASRHNPSKDTKGEWPKTLIDYCPTYRSGKGSSARLEKLCAALRQASLLFEAGESPSNIVDIMNTGLVFLTRHLESSGPGSGQDVNKRNLWPHLAAQDPALPRKLKRLLREYVIVGRCAWSEDVWRLFERDLMLLLWRQNAPLPKAAAAFLEFVQEGSVSQDLGLSQSSRTSIAHNGVRIRLGSVHSVKGKTVDAMLMVETEVWKGNKKEDRTMDLASVLPCAFGIESLDLRTSAARLSAATNVFVACTRPREFLACAVRKQAVSAALIDAARVQGWNVINLCTQQ